ncbi:hypothetical protein DdX_09814 [Ditylenchus destructor]|uniref:Uncharacterized protein n=1 Tax=Ditylenchus destructor TaxID=166010 RepID=A0AAD4R640_9BILA|nr:hypothetical protein DdX_09814 [Ditylenchus destructor]
MNSVFELMKTSQKRMIAQCVNTSIRFVKRQSIQDIYGKEIIGREAQRNITKGMHTPPPCSMEYVPAEGTNLTKTWNRGKRQAGIMNGIEYGLAVPAAGRNLPSEELTRHSKCRTARRIFTHTATILLISSSTHLAIADFVLVNPPKLNSNDRCVSPTLPLATLTDATIAQAHGNIKCNKRFLLTDKGPSG